MMRRTTQYCLAVALSLVALSCSEDSAQSVTGSSKSASQITSTADGPDHMDVVFYNVENLFDTHDDRKKRDDDFTPDGRNEWTGKRYQKKLINLAEVITAMKEDGQMPGLIGMAEVENEGVLEDMADKLLGQGAKYTVVHEDSPDMRGIDVGLLYRSDLFEEVDHEAIRIKFSNKGLNSRDILYFKGRLFNGEIFHVYLNHWPSRREGQKKTEYKRIEAAETLREHVDEVLDDDSNAKIIILGDFNDYPDNKSIADVLGASYKSSPKNELNNLAYPFEKKGLGTYNYRGDWGMLDQAIVSGALLSDEGAHVASDGLEIFKEDFFLYYDKKARESKPNKTYGGSKYYGGYSDHLPIILHLDLTD